MYTFYLPEGSELYARVANVLKNRLEVNQCCGRWVQEVLGIDIKGLRYKNERGLIAGGWHSILVDGLDNELIKEKGFKVCRDGYIKPRLKKVQTEMSALPKIHRSELIEALGFPEGVMEASSYNHPYICIEDCVSCSYSYEGLLVSFNTDVVITNIPGTLLKYIVD